MPVEASLEFVISLFARLIIPLSWDDRCDALSLTQVFFFSGDGNFTCWSGGSRTRILEIFFALVFEAPK